jgi:hypothetical protein
MLPLANRDFAASGTYIPVAFMPVTVLFISRTSRILSFTSLLKETPLLLAI